MKNAKPKKKSWKEEFLDMCGLKADLEVRLNDVARDRDRADEELERVRSQVSKLHDSIEQKNKEMKEMRDLLGHLCEQVCILKASTKKDEQEMPF